MRRVLVAALLLPLLSGCGSDQDAYCEAVAEHQQELSEIVGSGESDALLRALDILEDLRAQAPDDITDEWQQVVAPIEALRAALDEAGVDPATYDRARPPAGLTDAQATAIDAAARQVGSAATLRALEAVDQQARDVCRTPLTL